MQFLSISKQKQLEWADECYRTTVKVMFKKMSAKQGIKEFEERALADFVNKYKYLHDMSTFVRMCPEDLTPKQKRGALRAITLIKEKRSEKTKIRACVDGRAHRAYITK